MLRIIMIVFALLTVSACAGPQSLPEDFDASFEF